MTSCFELLGVCEDADAAQVRRAFRARAFATHPDRCPDDPAAAARFRQLCDARDTLLDPRRRAAHLDACRASGHTTKHNTRSDQYRQTDKSNNSSHNDGHSDEGPPWLRRWRQQVQREEERLRQVQEAYRRGAPGADGGGAGRAAWDPELLRAAARAGLGALFGGPRSR